MHFYLLECNICNAKTKTGTAWGTKEQVSSQLQNPDFLFKNPDVQLQNPDFLLKNPEFLSKNPDFWLKNVDFIMKNTGAIGNALLTNEHLVEVGFSMEES